MMNQNKFPAGTSVLEPKTEALKLIKEQRTPDSTVRVEAGYQAILDVDRLDPVLGDVDQCLLDTVELAARQLHACCRSVLL